MSEKKAADSGTLAVIRDWAKDKFALITQSGYKVDLEINNSTFVITPKLYDKNNNLISTGTGVDLPLESVVVNGSYDNTNKKIILTLKNGNTVDIPVSGLVSGLYSKPSTGIPKTDLAEAVQTSLGKADTAIQSHQDISGKVNGPSSSVNGRVAIFDGTSGKTIKDSGFTIGKSVPSDAVFTDTTYESKSASSGGTAVSLVTTGEKYTWNNKGTYSKPSGGIPKTDLADAVQTSLGKADSAIQSHQDITGKANKSEMSITSGTGTATIQLKSGTSATVLTEHQDISGKADKPTTTTVTIATTDWSSLSCTKSVTGMTASKIVLVSPAPASFTAYTDAGVRCSAQGSGTLSFACDSVPSSSVTVNILILG